MAAAARASSSKDAKTGLAKSGFRWANNEDAMATENLAEGIRLYAADRVKLEDAVKRS
ncbi:MAG: hypothetical protein ACR2RL_14315 [Gammaproteobacteria bacterium]